MEQKTNHKAKGPGRPKKQIIKTVGFVRLTKKNNAKFSISANHIMAFADNSVVYTAPDAGQVVVGVEVVETEAEISSLINEAMK